MFCAGFRWVKHDPISHPNASNTYSSHCRWSSLGMLCLPRPQVWGACLSGLGLLWPHGPLLWLAPSRVLLVLSPARTARFASFFLASVSKNSVPLCAKEDDLQNILRRKLTRPLLLAEQVGEFVRSTASRRSWSRRKCPREPVSLHRGWRTLSMSSIALQAVLSNCSSLLRSVAIFLAK